MAVNSKKMLGILLSASFVMAGAGAAHAMGASGSTDRAAVPYEFAFKFDNSEFTTVKKERQLTQRLHRQASRYCKRVARQADAPVTARQCTQQVTRAVNVQLAQARSQMRFAAK